MKTTAVNQNKTKQKHNTHMKTKETTIAGMGIKLIKQCTECGRVFDVLNSTDAEEWEYGHDCEETTTTKQ